jgi:hypothetical protein
VHESKVTGLAEGAPLARFYFDVREGAGFSPDDEGFEYADLHAAERMATESAVSIAREELPKRDAGTVTIDVRNDHKQRVFSVTIAMTTERV